MNFMNFFCISVLVLVVAVTNGLPIENQPTGIYGSIGAADGSEEQVELNPNDRAFWKNEKVWPNGIVFYQFNDKYIPGVGNVVGSELRTQVRTTMDEIEQATSMRIKFMEDPARTSGVLRIFEKSFMNFVGCFAEVGYHPEKQYQYMAIALGNYDGACYGGDYAAGVIAHELMHVLGFLHEFQRTDRDKYIQFDKDKVQHDFGFNDAGYNLNFGIDDNQDIKNLTFDYLSIMQYDLTNYVAELPNPSPKPKGHKINMGHLCALSANDLNLIERTYYQVAGGKDAVPKMFTQEYKFKNANCKEKLHVMMDEMD